MSQPLVGPPLVWPRARRPILIVAVVSLVLCAAGALIDRVSFFRAYLVAYLFWAGIALGCLALLMLQHLTGGRWGAVLRRLLEAAVATLPLVAILFVPVALGVDHLYAWTHPQRDDHVLEEKALYLNVPFFLGRAAAYFVLWTAVGYLLLRWSHAQEPTYDPQRAHRLQLLSGPGLIVYGLGVTFAAIDWVMSLDPHWFSSIFGVIVAVGQMLSAFAFSILVLAWLARHEPLASLLTPQVWHDLGNLLLAFVMIWTYVSFSQFLLIWSGNLPEEIEWYEHRAHGPWLVIVWLLVLFNFALPFFALLMRGVKREPRRLALVAGSVVALSLVHQYWLVTPSVHPGGAGHLGTMRIFPSPLVWLWLDAAAVGAIGAAWLALYVRRLDAYSLLPYPEPETAAEVSHG
jgi:hypothetical protein